MSLTIFTTIHPDAPRVLGPDVNPDDFAIKCMEEHRRILDEKIPRIRKDAPESAVTLVQLQGLPEVCVKQIRCRGFGHSLKSLFRTTQGARAFRNGRLLLEKGFGAAMPLALVTEKAAGLVKNEWVIMEVVPGALELDRYILKKLNTGWGVVHKREFVRSLGMFIGSMHAGGTFHADLKSCNIMVSESGDMFSQGSNERRRFFLVDYDDVRFTDRISERMRLKNLEQLFLSIPKALGGADRLRFLAAYADRCGLNVSQRRDLALGVLKGVSGRQILYVGPNGDVREQW